MCGIFCFFGQSKPDTLVNVTKAIESIKHRGPENITVTQYPQGYMAFARLAINGLTTAGNQPLIVKDCYLICNGEIFNHHEIAEKQGIHRYSSDCEVILPIYRAVGIRLFEHIDGEYAMIIYDRQRNSLIVARDPLGIRPLFIGRAPEGLYFASEAKAIIPFTSDIFQFPAGIYRIYDAINLTAVFEAELPASVKYNTITPAATPKIIYSHLESAVKKRIFTTERPLGLLLSGGLDSSITATLSRLLYPPNLKLHSFTIGLESAPDLPCAREMAQYLGTEHHEIIFTPEEGIAAIPEVIWHLETWDTTTIRASVPQYLMAKWISKNTDIKVLITGEGSDELFFGYKYHSLAPNPSEAQAESVKLLKELPWYDVLRTDRTMAAFGLEVRVPFLDPKLVNYIISLSPETKMKGGNNTIEKQILRQAFTGVLPESILMRPKDAFSDSVGHSWVSAIKEYCETVYDDKQFKEILESKYNQCSIDSKPYDKESLWYREIFHTYFPATTTLIPHYWKPNWSPGIQDPSARFLKLNLSK